MIRPNRSQPRFGLRRFGRAALVALALSGACATAAAAHAHLTASDPADGATLSVPPENVTLSFSDPVVVTAITITDPAGTELETLRSTSLAPAARLTLPFPALPPGDYRAEWRAQSADGHPMSGTLSFSLR